jgi:hypothetical protein
VANVLASWMCLGIYFPDTVMCHVSIYLCCGNV